MLDTNIISDMFRNPDQAAGKSFQRLGLNATRVFCAAG